LYDDLAQSAILRLVFTGIVEVVGKIESLDGGRLSVWRPAGFADPPGEGESIAINGVCLTVLPESRESLLFDLSRETLERTSLGDLSEGNPVNLERAMRANGLFGGHIVQGHVDATGRIVAMEERGNSVVVRFQAPPEFDRYLIDKGSVCIDGISLTVVEPRDGSFDVWVIPHTLANTNLASKRPGDRVNLEFDVIAKYVEKILAAREAK
jgi:riboflavin synthase